VTEGPGAALVQRASSTRSRLPLVYWAGLVLPLWGVLILCTHWEPVMGDGWHHHGWHRTHQIGLGSLYEFGKEIYFYENPRLGQIATLIAHSRGPLHSIVTPIVELGILAMLTVLALGRIPSVRRADDAWVALVVAAMIAACVPQIGPMLLYRPYTGNYAFGLAMNLLWLVPYRLEVAAPGPPRAWLAPVMLALGLVAGLCNEHTGLAFVALGLVATLVALRRGLLRSWMIAGLVGLATGYALLLLAPGQDVRYQGLAGQSGIVDRITERGAMGNLRIVGVLALALVPALPLLVIAAAERWTGRAARGDVVGASAAGASAAGAARGDVVGASAAGASAAGASAAGASAAIARATWAALALGGVLCTLTLLASPKIGPRLYFASVALITAGGVGWLAAQLRRRWSRRLCAVLAAVALAYVELRLLATYRVVGPLAKTRLERLERAAPGSVVSVPRYPVQASRYFLGDDFAQQRREAVAGDYALKAVELAND
jgi:Family of unknown function (DUF6056)